MRLSTIVPALGVSVVTLSVFALITTWAVSESTPVDSTLWYYPAAVLVFGAFLMVVGRRINH